MKETSLGRLDTAGYRALAIVTLSHFEYHPCQIIGQRLSLYNPHDFSCASLRRYQAGI